MHASKAHFGGRWQELMKTKETLEWLALRGRQRGMEYQIKGNAVRNLTETKEKWYHEYTS